MKIFLNGIIVPESKAMVSVTDHGFLYGDGVYETLRVYKGRPFLLHEHLRRLNHSLRGIRLTPPMSLMELGHAIQQTIKANNHREAVVRLTISRGPGEYGFNPALCKKATVVITSMPFKAYPPAMYKKGACAAVVQVRRNSPLSLPPSVKSTNCLNGILAKMESLNLGADEGIMLTQKGDVAEGTVSNVFTVKKRVLATPMLDGELLAGVTRAWVSMLARQAGYSIEERTVTLADLVQADEVFLTNTTMEVMPIGRLIFNHAGQAHQLKLKAPGPITRDLMRSFAKSIA